MMNGLRCSFLLIILLLCEGYTFSSDCPSCCSSQDTVDCIQPIESLFSYDSSNSTCTTFPFLHSRIVGLGEGAHYCSEFKSLKARIIENILTSDSSNHLILVEEDPGVAWSINNYIHGRHDNYKSHLTFDIRFQECVNYFEWLRSFVQLHPKAKIEYISIDPYEAYYPSPCGQWVKQFLSSLGKLTDSAIVQFTPNQSITLLRNLLDSLHNNEDKTTLETALLRANLWLQSETIHSVGLKNDLTYRDSCMAVNAVYVIDHSSPRNKVVIDAHNVHISRFPRCMGSYISNHYLEDYVPLALTAGSGTYQSLKGKDFVVNVLERNISSSIESVLTSFCQKNSFVNFQSVNQCPNFSAALSATTTMRKLAAIAESSFWIPFDFQNDFDGMFFLKSISPAHSLD